MLKVSLPLLHKELVERKAEPGRTVRQEELVHLGSQSLMLITVMLTRVVSFCLPSVATTLCTAITCHPLLCYLKTKDSRVSKSRVFLSVRSPLLLMLNS